MVSANRSATGKPLLANDPHLRLTNPAAFYLASLKIPGLSLTGANFAGAPLFVIGHNQRIAWGYTNTGSHIQDAYLERVDPQDPRRYLTRTATGPSRRAWNASPCATARRSRWRSAAPATAR